MIVCGDPKSDGVGATEIYHAALSKLNKKLVSIGTQDNGELYYDGIWKTDRGGDWGSRVNFDFSEGNTIYYLENGERRSFTPYMASNSYHSPFNPTNNSRIAFHPGLPDIALLTKDPFLSLRTSLRLYQPGQIFILQGMRSGISASQWPIQILPLSFLIMQSLQ